MTFLPSIDLHMHSRYSEDGEYTPLELAEKCAAAGIRTMSVTDHNCAKANEAAEKAAAERGIRYIPGIEIDCTCKNVNFHVLGYGIDFRSSDFEKIEKNMDNQSFHASLERLDAIQALGFRVTKSDMWEASKNSYWKTSWTGELFAQVLLGMPAYAKHPLLKPYRPGGERSDNPYVNFYWDYCAQGKPCYVKTEYPTMEEILDLIHRNHGAAVLAHPGVNLKGKESLLKEIVNLGFDGIEAFSSYHSAKESEFFYETAQKNNLFVTCGSDYHGKTKPSIAPGQHNCPLSYPEMENQLNRMLSCSR